MQKEVTLPECPECNKPLEEVHEQVDAVQIWLWDKEKKQYTMGDEKWYDTVTRCGNCQAEIDNTFLLDHLQPIEDRHYYPFPITLKEFNRLKEAYQKYQQDEYDYFEEFIQLCEKLLK